MTQRDIVARSRHNGEADRRRHTPFVGPYLDEYRSDVEERGTVGKLQVVAFQRRHSTER